MAKKKKLSKGERIREAVIANPNLGPPELANLLRAGGIEASTSQISKVKAQVTSEPPVAKGRRKGAKGSKAKRAAKRDRSIVVGPADDAHYHHLGRTLEYIHNVGGLENARLLLEKVTGFLV
jgi:hypothetical protein